MIIHFIILNEIAAEIAVQTAVNLEILNESVNLFSLPLTVITKP